MYLVKATFSTNIWTFAEVMETLNLNLKLNILQNLQMLCRIYPSMKMLVKKVDGVKFLK